MSALSTTRDGTAWDTTLWRYDFATGLATNKVYADNSVIAYTYTDDGKLDTRTWARGNATTYSYNANGLSSATTYSDATPAVSRGYDDLLRLAAASNAVAVYIYANDTLGAVTNETTAIGTDTHVLVRAYDRFHRLSTLTVDNAPTHYGYDAESRLVAISNASFVAEYAYTSDGYDAGYSVTLTNGVVLSRELTRDQYRRGLIKTITNSVDGVPMNPLSYSYDDLNRATSRNADTFGYNARGEVTSASILSNAYAYAYDFIGSHATATVNSATTTYAANAINQYTAILCAPAPLREPSYDRDGNLLTNGVFSYSYDAENRLAAAYSNSVCVVSNAYDHASRRVLKVTPTATHIFVYDGWNLIQETIQNQQSTITNHYVWGKDLSGSRQGAGGVGGLLAVRQGNAWYFPLTDANGNITAYINEQGSVVAVYTYDAFGATIASSGSMTAQLRFRFSTKYYDPELSLYYYGYRFYDPILHRWLNRDPIEEGGGLNLYAFCRNDGVNRGDLFGLSDVTIILGPHANMTEWKNGKKTGAYIYRLEKSSAFRCRSRYQLGRSTRVDRYPSYTNHAGRAFGKFSPVIIWEKPDHS
jgi:RHS repeat-associated protein